MEIVELHIKALGLTLKKLLLGKFWVYLIPGVILSLLFWNVNSEFYNYQGFSNPLEPHGTSFGDKVAYFFTFLLREIYKFLVLTFLSPVYCLLSEKVDQEFSGKNFSFNWMQLFLDVVRAFFTIFIALCLNAYLLGMWFFISFLTGFHQLDTYIYIGISSFFIGFAFYDYSMERYKVGVFSSFTFVRKNKSLVLLTGLLFYGIFFIPYIGVCLAPFIISIVSTIIYLKKTNRIELTNDIG